MVRERGHCVAMVRERGHCVAMVREGEGSLCCHSERGKWVIVLLLPWVRNK